MRLAISLELQPESGHLLAARLIVICSLYLMKYLLVVACRRKVRSGNGSIQLVFTGIETLVGKVLS